MIIPLKNKKHINSTLWTGCELFQDFSLLFKHQHKQSQHTQTTIDYKILKIKYSGAERIR